MGIGKKETTTSEQVFVLLAECRDPDGKPIGLAVAKEVGVCGVCRPLNSRECHYCMHEDEESLGDRFTSGYTGVALVQRLQFKVDEHFRNKR